MDNKEPKNIMRMAETKITPDIEKEIKEMKEKGIIDENGNPINPASPEVKTYKNPLN